MDSEATVPQTKGSNAWFKKPQIMYSLQLSLILLLAISLLMSNPIRDHQHDVFNQTLIPSTIVITRSLDPLHAMLRKGDVPAVLQTVSFGSEDDDDDSALATFTEQTVLKYINKYVFLHDDDDTEAKKRYAAYGSDRGRLSPLQITMLLSGCYGPSNFTLTWLRNNADWINPAVAKGADAATPNKLNWLLPVALQLLQMNTGFDGRGNDGGMCSCLMDFATPNIMKVEADSNADKQTRYQYDTCLAQNLQDYTLNGKNTTLNSLIDNAHALAFVTGKKRYRDDPLLSEMNAYFTSASALAKIEDDAVFANAMVKLCYLDTDNHLFSAGTACSSVTSKTHDEIKAYFVNNLFIPQMYAWNKARPPLLREERDTAANPPEIKAQDYKMYMQSYQHAFAICRHSAAPVYETVTVSRVRVFDYMRLGQGLLLLGALVGFMYWRSTANCCESGPEKTQLLMFLKVLAFLVELLILVSVCISLAMMTAKQDYVDSGLGTTNDLNPDNIAQIADGSLMSWVLGLTWVFVVVVILLLTFLTVTSLSSAKACLPFAPAQVGMDLCIIAGLANMAVGIVLQRGFGDQNFVVGTFVLFTTVGLMQHISNMARICQQFICFDNYASTAESRFHQITIAWNRTVNAVLVILLLVAFGTSASTTFDAWTSDMLYSQQHMWIFIAYAVAVFCGHDAYNEMYAGVRSDKCSDTDATVIIGRKMRMTAWILIVGSVVLHFHQYTAMCLSKEPFVQDSLDDSAWTACQPFGYLYGNTRFYEWG